MAADNLQYAINLARNIVPSVRKKVSNLRTQLDSLSADLDKLDIKLENIVNQSDVYRARVEREMTREVRRLEKELALLRKTGAKPESEETSESTLKIASTIGIFDTILRHMCSDSPDFRLASEAFLFPAVYERVMAGDEDAYFLDEIPQSALLVMTRGQEHIAWIREEYDTHITDPATWEDATDYIAEWWRNDALPLLYGSRDDQWDIDIPLSLPEMLLWRESPADRALNFPRVFDAYEIYRKHKDEVYGSTGLREFELKLFTFEAEKTP